MPNDRDKARKVLLSYSKELAETTSLLRTIRLQLQKYVVRHTIYVCFWLIASTIAGSHLYLFNSKVKWLYLTFSLLFYIAIALYYYKLQKHFADMYINNHKYASNLLSFIMKIADWSSLRKQQMYNGVDKDLAHIILLYHIEVQRKWSPSRSGTIYYNYITIFQIPARMTAMILSIFFVM